MNLSPHNTVPRRAKLFCQQSSFRSKITNLSQLEEPKNSFRSHVVELGGDHSRRYKDALNVFPTTIPHFERSTGELETTRETSGRDNRFGYNSPPKLGNISYRVNAGSKSNYRNAPSGRIIGQKNDNISLSSYLGYLDSSPNRDIESFRKKMVAKLEASEGGSRTYKEESWIESILPIEFKVVSSGVFEAQSKSTLLNVPDKTILESPKVGEYQSPTHKRQKSRRMALGKLRRVDSKNQSSVETCADTAVALKLAEEVAKNYRIYQETAVRNRDLQSKITAMLLQEGVLEIFLGKIYRQLSLPMRIYKHMVEFVEHNSGLARMLSVDKVASQLKREHFEIVNTKAKLILPHYQAYQRVNEKLQEVNIEFKVQEVQSLENRFIQAHEDFKSKKVLTLERISKIHSKKKLLKIKTQVESMRHLVPVHGEVSEKKLAYNESPVPDDCSNFALEARKVNRKLNTIVKRIQDNIA